MAPGRGGTTLGSVSPPPTPQHTAGGPWFRARPRLALLVAGLLYVGILTLRMVSGGAVEAYSMLYELPVALVAIAVGLRAGLLAGLLAVGLTVLWTVTHGVSLGPLAWASRIIPLLLLGLLVGDASDRLRRAEVERRRLEVAAQLHRRAVEINDSLVQGMVAAKWSLESGDVDTGLATLTDTIKRAHELVSGLIREAEMGPGSDVRPGAWPTSR